MVCMEKEEGIEMRCTTENEDADADGSSRDGEQEKPYIFDNASSFWV